MNDFMNGVPPRDTHARSSSIGSRSADATKSGKAVDYLQYGGPAFDNYLHFLVEGGTWVKFENVHPDLRDAILQHFMHPTHMVLYVWYTTSTKKVNYVQFRYSPKNAIAKPA